MFLDCDIWTWWQRNCIQSPTKLCSLANIYAQDEKSPTQSQTWDGTCLISVAREKDKHKMKDMRRDLPNLGPMKQQPMREQPPASRWTTPGCFRTCSYFHWNVVFLIIEAALSKSYYDNPAEHLSLQSLWSSRGSPGRKDISSTDQLICISSSFVNPVHYAIRAMGGVTLRQKKEKN